MGRHITDLEATYVAIESNKRGSIILAAPPSDPVDSGREIKPSALSEVPENPRSAPPRVRKPQRNSDRCLAPTADLAAHRGELRRAFGKTLSDEFAEVMLGKLVEALSPGPYDGLDESTLNAAVAQGGSAVALKRDAQRRPRKDDAEARHLAEIERLRAVVAEITAENLELKKKI